MFEPNNEGNIDELPFEIQPLSSEGRDNRNEESTQSSIQLPPPVGQEEAMQGDHNLHSPSSTSNEEPTRFDNQDPSSRFDNRVLPA